MICKNCKKTIDDDSMFCKYCGKPQQDDWIEKKFGVEGNASRKTMNPLVKKIIIGLVILCALVVEGNSIYKRYHKDKINLEKFVKIRCEGYDGYGEATCKFDYKKFSEEVKDSLGIDSTKSLDEIIKNNSKEYGELGDCILAMKESIKFNKDSSLSNGDEIVLTLKYKNDLIDKYGIKLTGGKIKYKVKELEKIKEVDPFKDLTVKFEGYSPLASVTCKNNSKEEWFKGIYFNADKTTYLKEGDVITITALYYDEDKFGHDYGVKFTQTEKEYTVGDVSKYILSDDEIDDNLFSEIREQTKQKIVDYFHENKKAIKVKGEINYEGYYFIHVRPDKVYNISAEGDYYGNYYEDYNSLIMVYSATVHDNRNDGYKAVPDEVEVSEPFDDTKIYFPVMVKNILKFWNGSLYCDYENMEVCGINDLMFYDGLNNNLLGYKTIKRMKNDLINSEFENFEYTSTGTLAE